MSRGASIVATILGVVLCVAVVAASQIPWTPEPEGPALVRLSWRAVLPSVEDCHVPTADELTGLPSHMRPAEICSGRPIPFRLHFVFDGDTIVSERVVGAGVRADRPMYVFHELRTVPGDHRVEVVFEPDVGGDGAPPATSVQGSTLNQVVRLDPLEILLVTREVDGQLVLRREDSG